MERTATFLAFSGQLLRHPRQVSAIAPSSPSLCRMMARQLPHSAIRVAEFGPGLGNITGEILRAGIAPKDLWLFELNGAFCGTLRRSFPGVNIVHAPAQALLLHAPLPVDAVVSGLPLLSMSREVQHDIVSAAFAALREDGVYIQFTYGLFPPMHRAVARDLGLTFTRTARVWRNAPPATVYVYRRERYV